MGVSPFFAHSVQQMPSTFLLKPSRLDSAPTVIKAALARFSHNLFPLILNFSPPLAAV
jgi:hypothetical protein